MNDNEKESLYDFNEEEIDLSSDSSLSSMDDSEAHALKKKKQQEELFSDLLVTKEPSLVRQSSFNSQKKKEKLESIMSQTSLNSEEDRFADQMGYSLRQKQLFKR